MELDLVSNYVYRMHEAATQEKPLREIPVLAEAMANIRSSSGSIYICGNGGSAGNAVHLANDLIYGAGVKNGGGLKVEALTANTAVLTCLANDTGYENIFSEQLKVKGNPSDLLIALSGSGNSPNIVKAIEVANSMQMQTFAILGYDGGKCKELAQHAIHFEVNDMQIAEDLQLIVGHICMQWLCEQKL